MNNFTKQPSINKNYWMKTILNFIIKLIFYSWLVLTAIVIFCFADRISNPETKGISNYDLKVYFRITFCLSLIYITAKWIQKLKRDK